MGTMRIVGASSTSAPFSRRRADSLSFCSLGLVTTNFFPASGRLSYHSICSSPATCPTRMMAGDCIFSSNAFRAMSAMVPLIFRCLAVVPLSRTAAGVSGGILLFNRPSATSFTVCTPIRNTSVPPPFTRAS